MAEYSREEIIDKIHSWLNEVEGASVEEVANPKIPSNYNVLKVNVTGESPKAVSPHEQQVKPEQISISYFIAFVSEGELFKISTYFRFNEYDNIRFGLLKTPDKVKFVNTLKIPIMMLNLSYMWVPDLFNFESIELSKIVYYDGFNKNIFFDSVSAVIHGYEICMSQYDQFINSIRMQG